ncbi:hypothetical protein [Streptomyces cyaneofuscatus]|uniref:hypothetical protein n=1 Tax=Streptomyces cyaneofuscatus TaxID=66883 RepID=UPI0038060BF7
MGVSDEREAPNDTVVGVGNSVSDGTFRAPVVQAGAVNGGVHTYYGQPHFSVQPPVSEWPRLGTADPIALGVRRTRRLPGESPLPPYVERDCDRELDARIRVAAQEGGLVVVTGAPLSGKTRTAWAALSANLPGTTRVFAPPPGTDSPGLSVSGTQWRVYSLPGGTRTPGLYTVRSSRMWKAEGTARPSRSACGRSRSTMHRTYVCPGRGGRSRGEPPEPWGPKARATRKF